MKAVACAIVIHTMMSNHPKGHEPSWPFIFHLFGMEMLMGYFLFYGG